MLRLSLLLASGLIILNGCSPLHQPQKVELPVPVPDSYLEESAESRGIPAEVKWWQAFQDSYLNQIMDVLFKQNLTLNQAYARLEQSYAAVRSARGGRFPAITLEAEAGRTMQPSFAGDFTGNNQSLAVAAGFELDLWGKLSARQQAAEQGAAAGLADLETLYLSLSAQLADLYYLGIEQRAQLNLVDQSIESFSETLELVENRYRQGLVPAIDIYQARQSLTAARANRHAIEAGLAATEHALSVLLARYPDRDSAGTLARLPSTPQTFPTGLPARLLMNRPDLSAALSRIRSADAQVAAAIAERFPNINLIGSFGRSRQEFATGLIEGGFWNLLAQLSMPLLDGGRRKADVEIRQAAVHEAIATYQGLVLQAFREVEDALSSTSLTEQRLAHLAATEAATEATLRLALDRYQNGITDYLPVLTAQRNHFEVQSLYLETHRQLISHRISLARSLGGHWMSEEIKQRLSDTRVDPS